VLSELEVLSKQWERLANKKKEKKKIEYVYSKLLRRENSRSESRNICWLYQTTFYAIHFI